MLAYDSMRETSGESWAEEMFSVGGNLHKPDLVLKLSPSTNFYLGHAKALKVRTKGCNVH